jgi:hypothetical protein
MIKINTVERPYTLTFHSSGHVYPISHWEAQRLIDEYPAVIATRNRVVLQGHNSYHANDRSTIRPATLGGGPAFLIEGKVARRGK